MNKRINNILVVSVSAVALSFPAITAHAEVLDLAAFLTGDCAGSGVSHTGWASFTLDTDTGLLTYQIDYDEAVVPFQAHIHVLPDACGNVPGGLIILFFPLGNNPIVGSTTLTPGDVQSMVDGNTYVNFHTGPFPDGEIAGVILPVPTNRYLSLSPTALTADSLTPTQAIRVTVPTAAGAAAGGGSFRWIGEPVELLDPGHVNGTFMVADLQCTPVFRDWSDVPFFLHVRGADVVPGAVYSVQFVDDDCPDLNDPSCYSDPLVITTSQWGDVVAPFVEFAGPSQPNFADISNEVAKFQKAASAAGMQRSDIVGPGMLGQPNTPDATCNFADVNAAVAAFQGQSYPYTFSSGCP